MTRQPWPLPEYHDGAHAATDVGHSERPDGIAAGVILWPLGILAVIALVALLVGLS